MGMYVVRRILQIVPTLLLITVLVFGLLHVTGGDPIAIRPEMIHIYTVHANYVSASRANVRKLPATLVRYTNVWIER